MPGIYYRMFRRICPYCKERLYYDLEMTTVPSGGVLEYTDKYTNIAVVVPYWTCPSCKIKLEDIDNPSKT